MKIWACFFCKKEVVKVEETEFVETKQEEDKKIEIDFLQVFSNSPVSVDEKQYEFESHLEKEYEDEYRFNMQLRSLK